MATLSELFGTNNEAAKLMKEKIDELLGKKQVSGGVMNLLDTPANAVQDAHRERYLMDMFSGKNPDTGESFLEPAETEYQKKVSRAMAEADLRKIKELEMLAQQSGMRPAELNSRKAAILGYGARGFETPAQRDRYMDSMMQKYGVGDTSEYTFGVDGATESYGFSGGDGLTDEAITNMRIAQGIIPMPQYSANSTASNLGFSGERGFETPAMRDSAHRVLSRLSEAEYRDVMEILPQLTPEQYMAFIAGLENGSINPSGYEVQEQNRLMRPY